MVKFIMMITDEGTEAYINPEQIVAMVPVKTGPRKGATAIMLNGSNGSIYVRETIPDLISALSK